MSDAHAYTECNMKTKIDEKYIDEKTEYKM